MVKPTTWVLLGIAALAALIVVVRAVMNGRPTQEEIAVVLPLGSLAWWVAPGDLEQSRWTGYAATSSIGAATGAASASRSRATRTKRSGMCLSVRRRGARSSTGSARSEKEGRG